MKKMKFKIRIPKQEFLSILGKLKKYNKILFVVMIIALYGVVLFKLQTMRNQHPSQESVSSQVKAAKIVPIDEAVVRQLQSLHDNSVVVQSLFDQARSNPFKE